MVWYWYCWSATPTFQPDAPQNSHEFLVPVFLWEMMLQPRGPSGVASYLKGPWKYAHADLEGSRVACMVRLGVNSV